MTTSPADCPRSAYRPAGFVVALGLVLAVVAVALGPVLDAHASSGPGLRRHDAVAPSTLATGDVVAPLQRILAGQHRARAPDYDRSAVGSRVAPNTTRAIAEIGPAGNAGALPGVRTQLHHSDPMFLGGAPKQSLTTLSQADHAALHGDMSTFLRSQVDNFGNHMAPTRANPGAVIRANFTRAERLQALADFYRGSGAVYGQPAIDFFAQHPRL